MSEGKIAVCTIEYQQQPNGNGESFVEVRRWDAEDRSELVLEHGQLDSDGDLQTTCMVLPFHFSTEQALASLGGKI